jgi:LysR family hydrogen peroxide-inducible transcriptional activator
MITLRQLHYFVTLARLRHFGRSAEECAVTQPALSVQIRDLEAVLGTRLIIRDRSGAILTEMGEEVARRARLILADTQELVAVARRGDSVLGGTLRLGVIPTIAPYLLPSVLPLLQERFPSLDLNLREAQTRSLVQELEDGGLDAVLLSLPVDKPRLTSVALFDDAFLLLTPAATPEPVIAPRVGQLPGDGLLLLEEGHCMRDQALAACQGLSVGTRRRFGAASLATIVQMVANGYGATLLPEMAIPVEVHGNPAVRLVRFAHPEPRRSIGLSWRRNSTRRRDFLALGEIIADAARRPRASTPRGEQES